MTINKLFSAAALLAALAAPACSAPSFEDEGGILVYNSHLQCVRPVSAGYRMYFSSHSYFSVYSATSTNGTAWGLESGVRLSTTMAGAHSSYITAVGAYEGAAIASGPYRAYYVGLSSNGAYSILSATSTDGLNWGVDSDFLLQFGNGARKVVSVAPHFLGSGEAVLYYVRDDGSRDPASHRVYAATSTDSGNSFSGEIQVLSSTGVYHLAVSTLTNGAIRLYASASLGAGSTAAMLLAADSADGRSFSTPVTVYSTSPAAAIVGFSVARSTDAYSWRQYLALVPNDYTAAAIRGAVTRDPVITGFTPNLAYDSDPATNFTVHGEIFDPAITAAAIAGAPGALTVTGVTWVSDMQLTVRALPAGAPLGLYGASVTNPGGRSGGRSGVLTIDYRPGSIALTDNLFRPLRGGSARADVTIYKAGEIKADVYTLNGGKVRALYSGPAAVGTKTFFWDGRTDGGRVAASGLYLLHVTGPKLVSTEKIVLIK